MRATATAVDCQYSVLSLSLPVPSQAHTQVDVIRPRAPDFNSYAAEGVSGWGGTMASAEHEAITGVRGRREAPLKLKAFWSLDVQRSRQI